MSTILKPFLVRAELLRRQFTVFSGREFRRIVRVTPTQAKYFLETYTAQGLFVRLKKDLYALAEQMPSELELANLLYRPSYISFEYALAFYGILPEMVYAVTSATTKPTRTFSVSEKPFLYFTIKRQAFTGYAPLKKENRTILMAEPEKALVDYLYFVTLGKKGWNDRLKLHDLDQAKLEKYAALYARARLEKMVEELL